MTEYDEIPPGTLYIHILILKTRAHGGEVHGFEIASSIQQATEEVPQVEEGSLYRRSSACSSKDGSQRNGA